MQSDVPSSSADDDQTYEEPAGAPPAEALFATRVAAEVARQLHAAGRELRFSLSPSAARFEVQLCDADGLVLSCMTPSRALEIATGAGLAAVTSRAVAGCGHQHAARHLSTAGA